MTTGRKLATALVILGLLLLANRLLDELRGPLQLITRLFIVAMVLYFSGIAFWHWWQKRSTASLLKRGSIAALVIAVVGWADIALISAVYRISGENYALIIIAPLAMLASAVASLAGLIAAFIGGAILVTAMKNDIEHRSLYVLIGMAAIVLNLAHIIRLLRIYELL